MSSFTYFINKFNIICFDFTTDTFDVIEKKIKNLEFSIDFKYLIYESPINNEEDEFEIKIYDTAKKEILWKFKENNSIAISVNNNLIAVYKDYFIEIYDILNDDSLKKLNSISIHDTPNSMYFICINEINYLITNYSDEIIIINAATSDIAYRLALETNNYIKTYFFNNTFYIVSDNSIVVYHMKVDNGHFYFSKIYDISLLNSPYWFKGNTFFIQYPSKLKAFTVINSDINIKEFTTDSNELPEDIILYQDKAYICYEKLIQIHDSNNEIKFIHFDKPKKEIHFLSEDNLKKEISYEKLIESLRCPITHEILTEPVIASDGFTYEKYAIEEWLKKNNTSPLTREPLNNANIYENLILKKIIDDLKIPIIDLKE